MRTRKLHNRRWLAALFLLGITFLAAFFQEIESHAIEQAGDAARNSIETQLNLEVSAPFEKQLQLDAGGTFEISVSLPSPSALPVHGRIGVEFRLLDEKVPSEARPADAFGIYTAPTANWRKVLHALDPDIYLVYRAPVTGRYALRIAPVVDETPVFEGARWRETGIAPQIVTFPANTPWPQGASVPLRVSMNPIDLTSGSAAGMQIEQEPNDTPEQAQVIELPEGPGVQRVLISGGADDIEYFDNGKVGRSGDDWFQIVFRGDQPRLLTANLTIPDHAVAAQLRFYASDSRPAGGAPAKLVEYTEGRNENERAHQQNEQHRASINRLLKPGRVYYLRAEANAPGYEIELRALKPAPYDDPRMSVRQGLYDHIGQVDSWLTNRPRGASVERRIRDTGNLMGTHCMSCHTQSGVWGPAVPLENGYRIENIQNYRHLINVMYESLRLTNYLKDAANNTSLAPLDIGDGPAGTRVAGHNVCTAERVIPARKLHSMQAIRAANHVLQTADPSGINAAGPGSNVGQSVVYNYAGEILRTAWDRTSHPRYFAALEEKAQKMLAVQPRYTDDMAHRIEFFKRFFPQDYVAQNQRAREIQQQLPVEPEPSPAPPAPKEEPSGGKPKPPPPARFPNYQLLTAEGATALQQRIAEQIAKDEARLLAIQNEDGSWGFDPGKSPDSGKTWKSDGQLDPAPTALALIALQALGHRPGHPAVDRGVQALLRSQDPYGRWNKSALTGFVTTAYALHALSRLYPETPVKTVRADFEPRPNDSLLESVARVRALSHTGDPALIDLMIQAASHQSPWVRAWGAVALGAVHDRRAVDPLLKCMGDRVKMVRDAAAWAMRQTLLDDVGFDAVLARFGTGDDLTRESIIKALGMRADTVMTKSTLDGKRLTSVLDKALNDDPHPGVRAWAAKAAWQWWVWNPPMRDPIQRAWVKKLINEEPNAIVENCFRYQSHALFIANGHKANGSEEHQYQELTALFGNIESLLDSSELQDRVKDRLARRLISIAATFYSTSGGDGGPGQMGYITPGSAEMMAKAALHLWKHIEPSHEAGDGISNDASQTQSTALMRLLLEGSSGVAYPELQERIISFSTTGPEELRTLAAAAVSDPTLVTLPATQEKVQPLVEQIYRGAQDYDRRQTLAQPVLKLIGRAKWAVPQTLEQQQILYKLLVPDFRINPNEAELKKILLAAEDAIKPMGQLDADWYIADRMGGTLAANPDLQTEVLLKMVPGMVGNPLTGHFWLPNVSWILGYGDDVPEIGSDGKQTPSTGEIAAAQSRAVDLYLQMLGPDVPVLSRSVAIRMANETALRQNPKVRAALAKLIESDRNGSPVQAAKNALRSDADTWTEDLREAVAKEPLAASLRSHAGSDQGPVVLTPEFVASFRYFTDHVAPEMNRPQRNDEMSCMKCHAVPGRVPSMELAAPDGNGYWTTAKMLKNYLTLQQRVNPADIEASKLLRKPLNIQTGKEDGHQGGRRYVPNDRGYKIIRRWVLDQPRVIQSLGAQVSTGTSRQYFDFRFWHFDFRF